ncbi:hypothetical protein ACP70R_017399 [Stipagrostis hirtigluma subsp. patula]
MCPRATAQHCGGAMAARAAAAATVLSFGEEEYIDLDLSSCGEFEFRVRRSSAADEPHCRARYKVAPRSGAKLQHEADAGGGCGGRRSAATVTPLQHSQSAGLRHAQPAARPHAEGSRRRKASSAWTVHEKLKASRAFFRSLFARTSCSDEQCHRAGVRAATTSRATTPSGETKSSGCRAPFGEIRNGHGVASRSSVTSTTAPTTLRSSIEQEKLMDEAELAEAAAARQRKSFSGVIKWRHSTTTTAPAPASVRPPLSSSARRSSVGGGGGGPALKKCSSARSESEGLIQGAIAYCKRSQQHARKSVSDAALCSFLPGLPPQLDSSSAVAYHIFQ